MIDQPSHQPPVGVLPRAAVLLRLMVRAGQDGLRLHDLAELSGINRATVHRLLADLIDLRAVTKVRGRRYALGGAIEDASLMQQAPGALRNREQTREVLQRVADEVGDTVYLAVRMFNSAHYVLRCDGASPVRVYSVQVGEFKPLATSFAGIALLSGLDADQRNQSIASAIDDPYATWPVGDAAGGDWIRRGIDQVRSQGWCGGVSVLPDVAGLACPVPRENAAPILALTISAATPRLPWGRIEALAPLLTRTADELALI